ncbi:MAG: hypothetical protein KBD19_03685 [Candidatus Moranbacteria bacterium]|nr:hypothetical protein [Candidatus Moranbacteria bacterium]
MFTMPAIYLLWQMVRDFFNLFFILTLLFIAFATIFQIDSFNYKKTLGKLLLMALLVNFSFPIARFVIDAANVPMYFFMESMFTNKSAAKAQDVASVAFGISNLENVLLGTTPGTELNIKGDSSLTLRLLVGIIFMFLFGVSLLALAVLFLIRSLMLVILIIFSSVGFAGMVIPGFRQYATKWWDNLLKYALFGPAAMLMMLVSIKFMEGFSGAGGIGNSKTIAGVNSSVAASDGSGQYLAGMVAVMAPIVLIWMSIAIGQTMGIHGAGMVTGRAQQFSKWAGRKASGADAATKRWRAYSSEREKRANAKFAATNIGTRLATKANSKLDQLSAKRIGGRFETEAARLARSQEAERQKARVAEAKKTHMLDQTSDKDLLEMKRQAAVGKAKTKDQKALHVAATQEISKRKLDESSGEPGHGYTQAEAEQDMHTVRENFAEMPGGVSNAVSDDTQKQMAQPYGEAAFKDKNGVLDEKKMREAIRRGEIDAAKISGAGITQNFMRLMAAEGKLNQQVVKTLKENNPTVDIDSHLDGALDQMTNDMAAPGGAYATASPEEKKRMEKSYTEMQKNYVYATGKFHSSATETDKNNVMKKADHETLMKMADTNKAEFDKEAARLAQMAGPGKTAAILAKMSEEGKDIQGAVDNLNLAANAFALPGTPQDLAQKAADKAVKRMQGDYRFDGIV